MADECRAPDGNCVQKRRDISREVGDAVAGPGTVRVAEPPLVDRKCMNVGREKRRDAAERERRIGPTMEEDDRFAARFAGLRVVNLQAGPEFDGCGAHRGRYRQSPRPPLASTRTTLYLSIIGMSFCSSSRFQSSPS